MKAAKGNRKGLKTKRSAFLEMFLNPEIEGVLSEIRNSGKQDHHNRDHTNFSRIMHDYSAAQKGFVIWKGYLEQQLI